MIWGGKGINPHLSQTKIFYFRLERGGGGERSAC